MTPDEKERLLDRLAELEEGSGSAPPDDAALADYRRRRLTGREARSLVAALGESPEGRRRLRDLAGLGAAAPPAEVRQRVLEHLRNAGPGRRRARRWIPLAAAVAAAAALLVLRTVWWAPAPLPAGLELEVAAHGLATVRGEAEVEAQEVTAYPDTRVEIVLRPRGEAEGGLAFGLYRESGGDLVKAALEGGVQLLAARGVATFSGPAAAFAAGRTGDVRLWLLVARSGDLPERLEAPSGVRTTLSGGRRRLAYPVVLHLLPAAEGQELEESRRETP